jgi:hypothetical protein
MADGPNAQQTAALKGATDELARANKKFPNKMSAPPKEKASKPAAAPAPAKTSLTDEAKSAAEGIKAASDNVNAYTAANPQKFHDGGVVGEKKVKNPSLYRAMHHLHKGGLHRALGVAEGTDIPKEKIQAATHSENSHIAAMAHTAKTMSHFKH